MAFKTGALSKSLVTMIGLATGGDPGGPPCADRRSQRQGFLNLHAAIEKSLQATNAADRQRTIEREAFPAFHDAKVKARTDELAAFMTETLITVTPGIAEVEAGFRAHQALEAYEAAIEAGDQEAAAQSLLEFGMALTEAVPLGGRFAKAGRFAPALDKAKARISKKVADLLGAGTIPGGPQLAMANPMAPTGVPKQPNIVRSDDVRGASGKPNTDTGGISNTSKKNLDSDPDNTLVRSRESAENYRNSLERKRTPNSKPFWEYEIAHTGEFNYRVVGPLEKSSKRTGSNGKPIDERITFDADGLRPNDDGSVTVLEAKYVGDPDNSPYIPGSRTIEPVRENIVSGLDDEFRRMKEIFEDPNNPVSDVEIITNNEEAAAFFRAKLKEQRLNGRVVIR